VARLRRAIEQQEKILIYGDYDVDGTMAVVTLLSALRSLEGKVEVFIPQRVADGYGMRVAVVEQAAAQGYRVVVSVDTGVREHEVIARANELGLDCIVTDHHLPGASLPRAHAILNPRRPDCAYPDKDLAGVGVALKLVQALLGTRLSTRRLESYLKIAAIGTIADVVPLVGENRVIARFGLRGLRRPAQVGLKALLAVSGLAGREITAGDVAFRLAPRLNAAGRMEDARQVVELLTTSDGEKAQAIADQLEGLNRQRQLLEEQILSEIWARLEERPEKAQRYSWVFAGEGWHRGVLGIVAQRVVDRFHRPTLVIGVEDGVGQGSARSIPGFHLLQALTESRHLFYRFGGHALAAGFTLPAECITELETRIEKAAQNALTMEDLEPLLRIDAEVRLGEINLKLYQELQALGPFGFGNPTPVLLARAVRLLGSPRVIKGKHLILRIGQDARSFEVVGWAQAGLASRLSSGQSADVAFTLEEDVFDGSALLKLVLRDIR